MVVLDNILEAVASHEIENISDIEALILQYPYFQPAWVLKTLYLKESGKPYKKVLQQTAARTIDRAVLYQFLNSPSKKIAQNTYKLGLKDQAEAVEQISSSEPVQKNAQQISQKPKIKLVPDVSQQKLSYLEWLRQLNKPSKPKKETEIDLIERFLKERPKIIPKKGKVVKAPDIIEKSVEEKQMLMTETLANLYIKQKKYDKAIQAFRILSLKYPKKSSYFANQIKEIKQKLK
jgi:hypothetical protein